MLTASQDIDSFIERQRSKLNKQPSRPQNNRPPPPQQLQQQQQHLVHKIDLTLKLLEYLMNHHHDFHHNNPIILLHHHHHHHLNLHKITIP